MAYCVNGCWTVSNRIGIGTDAPVAGLHIVGVHTSGLGIINAISSDSSILNLDSSTADARVRLKYQGGERWFAGMSDTAFNYHIQNGNNGCIGLAVSYATGYVGIGTCDPIGKLHVQNGQIRIQGAPSDTITGTQGYYLANTGNNEAYNWQMSCNFNLGLWTFSSSAGGGWGLRGPVITQSGKMGIGCDTPRNTLEIIGGTSSPALCATNCDLMKIAGSSNSSLSFGSTVTSPYSMWMQVKHQNVDNTTYPLSLQTCGGNVGIGILNPGSYKLYVNGSFYSAGSSCEYKTQICQYNTDSCMFMKLTPVTYQYKDEYTHLGKELKSGTQIGLIAEDVAEVYPELAILKDEDDIKIVRNVDYEKLSIILLSEVQKLRKEVDNLKNNK